MAVYEIGIIYRKGSRLFIATDESTLLGCIAGVTAVVRPHTQYKAPRNVTVEDLCNNWGVELEEFDQMMSAHVAQPVRIKTRPRGSRRDSANEDDYWRRHRTGRILRPKL